MKISIQSEKKDVMQFLNRLYTILDAPDFSVDNDLLIIKSNKTEDKKEYSTPYTLMDLEYDRYDVAERLKELEYTEYVETLFDRDDEHPPLLFVFGKEIGEKTIYIKLKIKDEPQMILCVSFHYAEHDMEYIYR